jgi:molybdate/tungstate transport system ATP-binding protein
VIQIEHLRVRAGAFRLADITFEVPSGGYTVLMGRTGSGKTTLLETLCGLKPATAGAIVLAGRDVTRLPPALRGIGYVPQDRALFQTMTVREHLAFAPRLRRWPHGRVGERIAELAGLLGIGLLLDRKPAGLSGGEAQRVALGRALAARPAVLCLDEPLSALDDETREEMIALLRMVRHQTGVTTLHVTHRLQEAERLADQVLELRDGKVQPRTASLPGGAPSP